MVKATTPLKKVKRESEEDDLENHKKDVTEKEQSVSMEMMKGLADRIQRIEEKLDLLISLSLPNHAAFKPVFANAYPFMYGRRESDVMDNDSPSGLFNGSRGPFNGGRGRGLYVGDRFRGGRCDGQGFCGLC